MSNTYFKIEDWMVQKLDLRTSELLIYALIYAFSKKDNWYDGSIEYLCDRVGVSVATAKRLLNNLKNKGLLKCKKSVRNGSNALKYKAISRYQNDTDRSIKMIPTAVSKCDRPQYQNDTDHGIKMIPLYKDINKEINKEINKVDTDLTEEKINSSDFDFCLLADISINKNGTTSNGCYQAFKTASDKLDSEDAPAEIIYAWYLYQQDLAETREPQFMPNLTKWLDTDAVTRVKSNRKARHYGKSKYNSTVLRLTKEYEAKHKGTLHV